MVQKKKNCFTASINISFSTYNSLKCLPCYVGDNEMLCSRKFHPRLLGNPNMLYGPNDHIVYQSGFHSHNQSSFICCLGAQVTNLIPTFFAITFFKNFCFFEGVENPLTCSGVSSLPLSPCE